MITAIVSAIEALAVALVVFVLIALPAILIWWLSFDMASELPELFSTVSQLWQLAHLVPMQIVVPAKTAVNLGLAAETLSFTLSVAPLGLTLITIVLGFRSGWRFAARGSEGAWALAGAFIGFLTAAVLVASAIHTETKWPFTAQVLIPAMIYGVSCAKAFIIRAATNNHEWWLNTVRWLQQHLRSVAPTSASALPARMAEILRLTFATLLTLVGLATLGTSVNILLHYVDIVALGQSLNLNALSLTALFLVQLVLLPIAWVWAIAWLSGAGFSIGIATYVTPFETLLGPLPALPLFGAVPTSWGWAGALAPVIIIAAAAVLGAQTANRPLVRSSSALTVVSITLGAAFITAFVVAAMSVLVHGSIGPGRLAEVGPDPWNVAGLIALETGFGLSLGMFARRLDLDRLRETTRVASLVPRRLQHDDEQHTPHDDQLQHHDEQDTKPIDDVGVMQPFDGLSTNHPAQQVGGREEHAEAPQKPVQADLSEDPLLAAYSWDSQEIDPLHTTEGAESSAETRRLARLKDSIGQPNTIVTNITLRLRSGSQKVKRRTRSMFDRFLGRDDRE